MGNDMTVSLLEKMQEILQKEVCDKVELRESADSSSEYKIVHPICFIGYKPPDMGIDELFNGQNSIPCLIIGVGKATDNGENSELAIEMFFAVDSPGVLDDNKKFTPNFEGYINLLNFIDKTKAFLLRDSFNFDFMIINSEIESGMCEEQAYPLWFGYLKFKIKYNAYPSINVAKYL